MGMNEQRLDWTILRQVVLGAADHDATSRAVREGLGLAAGFADPLLASMGLRDETIRIGGEAHLEIVSPLSADASINRWLEKVGGLGGFSLSIQVPDVAPLLEAAAAAGVRVLMDERHFGRRIVQLHPGDMGLLVELDEIPEPTQWFWDDIEADVPEAPAVDDVLGVEVASADPAAQARLWAQVLGAEVVLPDGAAAPQVWLGSRWMRFVEGGTAAMTAVDLRATGGRGAGVAESIDLGGVALRVHGERN